VVKFRVEAMKSKIKPTRLRKPRVSDEKIDLGGGNVFADLGFQDAEERLLKAKLATKITQLIQKKGWTQARTADRTALDQPKVSRLLAASFPAFQRTACSPS
jgi:predicted XRE-type DNA-binding protein